MRYKIIVAAVAVTLGALSAAPVIAADAPRQLAQAEVLADGEIRKVDKDAKKITIKHGPIANLDMPGMTMVFQVKDPALLDRAKAGEKVRFAAEKIGGAYVVTRIEPTK